MYAFNSHIVNKATESIIDNMDDKFEDIDDKFSEIDNKLQSIEELINTRLEVCYNKVNDIYSLQNKVNEITKMNNQSILHQINQYDEEIEDIDINRHNTIYNSLETSMSPQSKIDKLNNKCFIKHTNTKNQDRELFYMSSMNKNEFQSKNNKKSEPSDISETSTEPEPIKSNIKYNDLSTILTTHSTNKNKLSSKSSDVSNTSNTSTTSNSNSNSNSNLSDKNTNDKTNLSKNDNIFSNLYKKKKSNLNIEKDNISLDNKSNLEQIINSLPENIMDKIFQKKMNNDTGSIILEMTGDAVTSCEVKRLSPKFTNAMKILNETNIIKNNSNNKLNEFYINSQKLSDSKFEKHDFSNENNNINLKNESDNKSDSESDDDSDSDSDSESNSESDSGGKFENLVDLASNSFSFADFTKKSTKSKKIVELV